MSDQNLPLSPDNRAHMMGDAVLAVCAPGTSEVLYGAIERAESGQGHVEVDYVAAVDSREFPGTIDYTRDDAAGASFDPGTASPAQPRAHSGVEDYAQTTTISNPATVAVGPTPGTVVARNKSRSPRRHGEEREPFGLTSVHFSHLFGFRDATLWCLKCGGWSAGSRRASRLKDPCGVPTKTGADVAYRVSGGFPPKARVLNSDDTSGGLERIPIIKNPYSKQIQATGCQSRRQHKVTCLCLSASCSDCGVLGPSTASPFHNVHPLRRRFLVLLG